MDESGSVGPDNFVEMQTFLSQLVARLDVNSGGTRVGLATFSTEVGETFMLDQYSTVEAVQAAIKALEHSRGGTSTNRVLRHVRTSMLTEAAGDRSDATNVVVVLTDGRSNEPSDTQVSCNGFTD